MKNLYFLIIVLNLSIYTPIEAQQRQDIWTLSPTERYDLRELMMSYITTPVVNKHLLPDPIIGNFHNYREEFLTWHRAYIADMEAYLLKQPGGDRFVPLPKWDPITVIPNEFFNDLVIPGHAVAPGWSISTITNIDPVDVDFTPIFNNLCNYVPSPGRTAIDNFADALETLHNPVHGNIGGIMGGFQSPAAAIFWLWHAWIDDVYRQYECDCQGIDANDLYTKDSVEDIGNEANDETTGVFYRSSDIWVRNTQDVLLPSGRYSQEDNPLRHQNPEYSALGNPNFVYVKVRNRGCNTLAPGMANLRVYWSKASTGLNWPTHFMNYFDTGSGGLSVLHGAEITLGSPVSIPTLAPGESFVAEIPWNNVPNPDDFILDAQHFCLLSRIESSLDPMTFPEGTSVGANTRNNNNIAWKNLTVVDLDPLNLVNEGFREDVVFFVRQTFETELPIKLVFNWSEFELANNTRIELDDNFIELILQSDELSGVEIFEDGQGNIFLQPTKEEGFIGGLFMKPDEIYAARLLFEINCKEQEICPQYGTIANLTIEQYLENDFADEFIGGNYYEIRITQDKETECGNFPIVDYQIKNPSCSNTPNGSINLVLEGVEPFEIYWNNGQNTQDLEGLLPGEYKVTVRDAQNCVNSRTIILSDESDLTLFFNPTHVTRFCEKLGSIKLTVEGGVPDYSVLWSSQSDNFNLEELETGMYIATVTDAVGCERIDSVNINQNFPIRINSREIQHASSASSNDGEIRIAVTGGEPPLKYSWSNGSDLNEVKNLAMGDYIVTISDQLGCTLIDSFTVDVASSLSESIHSGFITISPNPASDQLVLNFDNIPNIGMNAQIEIISIAGQIKNNFMLSLQNGDHIQNIKDYPSGTYLVKIKVGNHFYVDKFVKQ